MSFALERGDAEYLAQRPQRKGETDLDALARASMTADSFSRDRDHRVE
jgi:hypothetical protein